LDEYNSSCELLFYERQSFNDLGFKKGDKMSDFVLFEFGLNQQTKNYLFFFNKVAPLSYPKLFVFKKTESIYKIKLFIYNYLRDAMDI
jgi:hypothetical protein